MLRCLIAVAHCAESVIFFLSKANWQYVRVYASSLNWFLKLFIFFIYLHMPPSKRWCFEWIVFTLFQFVSLLLKCKAKSIARSSLTRLSHIHWISIAVVIAMQSKSNSLNWICCHLHCTHFRAHKIDLWIAERLQIICLNGNFSVSLH